MWQDWSDILKDVLAVLIVGVVVKITDDYIDQDEDTAADRPSLWLSKLGKGVLPYTIIVFSVAVVLNFRLSIGLFLSAFIVGMFKEPDAISPLGLKGYQETGLIFFSGLALVGAIPMINLILLMLLLQFLDDWFDYTRDSKYSRKNFFVSLGRVEASILLFILIFVNIFLQPIICIAVLLSMLAINKVSLLNR